MGLAPWASSWASSEQRSAASSLLLGGRVDGAGDEALRLDWPTLDALPQPNRFNALVRQAGDAIILERGAVGSSGEGMGEESVELRGMCAYALRCWKLRPALLEATPCVLKAAVHSPVAANSMPCC